MFPPLFKLTDHVHGNTGALRKVFLREVGQATQAPECLPKVLFACYHVATLRREGARAPLPREGSKGRGAVQEQIVTT